MTDSEPGPQNVARTTQPALARQVSQAVLWNTIFVPLRLFAEVVAMLVKLNLLTPASYGLLALVSGASNGLGTTVDLGTARALPKYIPETSRRGGPRATLRLLAAVFVVQMLALLVISIALIGLSSRYIAGLNDKILADERLDSIARMQLVQFVQDHAWLIIGVILIILFTSGICYDMLMAYLNSFFKQRAWNGVTLVAGLLPPLLSAGALLAGWGITGVLVAMLLAPTISATLAGWQVFRLWWADHRSQRAPSADQPAVAPAREVQEEQRSQTSSPPASSRWFGRWPRLLRPAFWLPPGFVRYSAVSYLMTMTDFVASASFAVYLAADIGDAALLWAGAALVRMALSYLYTPMVGVQVPLFTRVRAGEGGTLLGAYQSLVRLQVLLMLPGGVGLIILARPALLVISPDYVAATALVWVLVPCLFLESLLTTAHNALIVYEHLSIIIISRLLALLAVVVLAATLPPLFGVLGVALAFGLARLVAGVWVTASGYRLLELRWPWRFTLRVVLASGIMALVVLGLSRLLPLLPDTTIITRLRAAFLLLGIAGVGALSFLLALRLTGGLDPQDRRQLAQMKLPLKRWLLRLV